METKYLNVGFDYQLKNDSGQEGFFEGYGSTFGGEPDSGNDVVLPGAFTKTLEMGGRNGTGVAMLWQHESHNPIGKWLTITENSKGLQVTGQLAVKTRYGGDAYELMKIKALQGLSIGYNPVTYEIDDKKKIRYLKEVELWEISPVTFPMNTRATITSVKSLIENAKTERELEQAFRTMGISNNAAQYLVSKCKESLFGIKSEKTKLAEILGQLKIFNNQILGKNQ